MAPSVAPIRAWHLGDLKNFNSGGYCRTACPSLPPSYRPASWPLPRPGARRCPARVLAAAPSPASRTPHPPRPSRQPPAGAARNDIRSALMPSQRHQVRIDAVSSGPGAAAGTGPAGITGTGCTAGNRSAACRAPGPARLAGRPPRCDDNATVRTAPRRKLPRRTRPPGPGWTITPAVENR